MILPQSIQITYDTTDSTVYPSQTYGIDLDTGVVSGVVDNLEAVKQAITKILLTDRYAYGIYDGYYGNELYELVGQSYEYVIIEIPRMITDALLRDDRITGVSNYSFTKVGVDAIDIEFEVTTVYGKLDINSRAVI